MRILSDKSSLLERKSHSGQEWKIKVFVTFVVCTVFHKEMKMISVFTAAKWCFCPSYFAFSKNYPVYTIIMWSQGKGLQMERDIDSSRCGVSRSPMITSAENANLIIEISQHSCGDLIRAHNQKGVINFQNADIYCPSYLMTMSTMSILNLTLIMMWAGRWEEGEEEKSDSFQFPIPSSRMIFLLEHLRTNFLICRRD